jgi:hypothetical protein
MHGWSGGARHQTEPIVFARLFDTSQLTVLRTHCIRRESMIAALGREV